jgi:hypothetical protein
MVKAFILGKMEEDMKENIIMIKNTDLVFIFGPMVENMRASGDTENNTGKENIFY